MARPGWSLIVPGSVTVLPVQYRHGAQDTGEERNHLTMETERGKRYVYTKFTRVVRRYVFRVTAAQLADFRALHDAVDGNVAAFYWVPDSAVPATYLYVRKEKDFLPVMLSEPIPSSRLLYDYTLELTGEPTDAEVDA